LIALTLLVGAKMETEEIFATLCIVFLIFIGFTPQGSKMWQIPLAFAVIFGLFWWKVR